MNYLEACKILKVYNHLKCTKYETCAKCRFHILYNSGNCVTVSRAGPLLCAPLLPQDYSKSPRVTINEMSGFLNPLVTKFRDVKFSFYSLKFRGVKLYFTQFYFPWNNGHYYLDLLN